MERVNLIKNHGFESEDESWAAYTGKRSFPVGLDSAQASTYDSERAFTGSFSGSTNTSIRPGDEEIPAYFTDSDAIVQGGVNTKSLSDFDSLI
ncbi:hypothetical protein GF359_00260 [candidate division WOR-3 bacterium]|uniref:Uncharacterized protein n=1 Tax=candidate division WOR-3 bacterium TaxID=2052148 RepID=A0A9D5K8K9_UNCW3|nr:hypothetical protein [candidate division WOR-3 bacterium]MBD3363625.1 hypothetical protein [candidate division WOR-3 bacterium]